jgi:replicative DNA helicase
MDDNNKPTRRKKSLPPMGDALYGYIPPQARELEDAVLGACMLEKTAFDRVAEILSPECFYVDAHQRIFKAMVALSANNLPIDMLTVGEQLKKQEELDMVGGPYYIMTLTNAVTSGANVEAHSRYVLEKHILRELIVVGGNMTRDAYQDATDVFDLLDKSETALYAIANKHLKKDFTSAEISATRVVSRIEDMRNNPEELSGVTSGYPSIDKVTHGWQKTDLIILAARPSVGKTAFALNLALNAAGHPDKSKRIPVGFFSLEMSADQCTQRILSAMSEIWLEKIARGRMEEHEMRQLYKRGVEALSEVPIFIDDSAALNVFELRAKVRRMVAKHNCGMIIIDYLQLMSGTGENKNSNREQEISKISREIKKLAKELQVPIIALSQLSREVEKRKEGNKMPQLSDLRESGAIEQDADMVMFLYRPEYYEVTADEFGESNKGETHVKIAKHRNGTLETIKLMAQLHIQKFIEYEEINITSHQGMHMGGNWKPVRDIDNSGPQPGYRDRYIPPLDDDAPF